MISDNFKKITLLENGLILKFASKSPIEISFSEIKSIYIKVKKTPVKWILLFVASSLSIVFVLLLIFGTKLVVFSPLFLIVVGVLKLNSYKRYVLKIKLKNGTSILQNVPLKLKYKTVEDIKKVRKVLSIGFN